MAKHRLEQPSRIGTAKKAVIAGSITLGSIGVAAGPALAAPITIPGIGNFEIPGLDINQIPEQLKPQGDNGGNILAPRESAGQKAVRAAESKIGSPYSYGAAGPSAFDCSGLVFWSYQQAGKTIPRDSYGQAGGGQAVSYADAKPGDVMIFNGGGHSGIYVGNGQFIHSSTYGVPVKRDAVKEWSLVSIRRY